MLLKNFFEFPIIEDARGENVCPKTENQLKLCEAIDNNDIIFVSGPAGTGKTMLAIAKAIQAHGEDAAIHKIVLSRPIVESGENLGFLPGTMEDKIHPYLIPLYDYLEMFLKKPGVGRKVRKSARKSGDRLPSSDELPGFIEIAPLAFLRGRTFNNSFIIIDEAQNISKIQMKLLLTRIGKNSKIVLTGDQNQSDLSNKVQNGFIDAIDRLIIKNSIPKIVEIKMDKSDILRNGIIKEILEAYEE